MPTRYLRLGPREQDTGSDDTSRRTEQDEEEFWPKLDKKTADRIGILNRWIYPVCRSVVTGRIQVQSDNVPEFLFKLGVVGNFESLQPMRLDVVPVPNALHGAPAHPSPPGHA